jgi:hypothetical protein
MILATFSFGFFSLKSGYAVSIKIIENKMSVSQFLAYFKGFNFLRYRFYFLFLYFSLGIGEFCVRINNNHGYTPPATDMVGSENLTASQAASVLLSF